MFSSQRPIPIYEWSAEELPAGLFMPIDTSLLDYATEHMPETHDTQNAIDDLIKNFMLDLLMLTNIRKYNFTVDGEQFAVGSPIRYTSPKVLLIEHQTATELGYQHSSASDHNRTMTGWLTGISSGEVLAEDVTIGKIFEAFCHLSNIAVEGLWHTISFLPPVNDSFKRYSPFTIAKHSETSLYTFDVTNN